jgi:hypothetical protein
VLRERCGPLSDCRVGQLEHDAPVGVVGKRFAGDWRLGGGQVDATVQRTNVQLTIIAAALGAVDGLRSTPRFCLDGAERLAIRVIRGDERFVESKPDPLPFGTPVEARDWNTHQRNERQQALHVVPPCCPAIRPSVDLEGVIRITSAGAETEHVPASFSASTRLLWAT